jgi:hypothetical protein
LGERVKAWEDGAWVREAALAHARKQQPVIPDTGRQCRDPENAA